MPFLAAPILAALTAGGLGFAAGSWWSDGWFKWLIILIIIVFLFSQAKKMGFIK